MNGQILALWVLTSTNAAGLLGIVTRAATQKRNARQAEKDPHAVSIGLGTRLPSLTCRTWEAGKMSNEKIGAVRPRSVVVFLRTRSVASFRITNLWLGLVKQAAPDIPWTWVIVGDPADASRWVDEMGLHWCAVYCNNRSIRKVVDHFPVAIALDVNGRVAQAGAIHDELTLAQFIAGGPDRALREWYSSASAARNAMLRSCLLWKLWSG